jgi:hypothetical protein
MYKPCTVARALNQPQQAAYHIGQILEGAKALSSHFLSYWALPVAALLLVDLGQYSRAVEVYSLVSRYPFVSNSLLFEDMVSKEIHQVKANMAPTMVESCRQSGENLPLWETVEELIAIFSSPG